MDDREAIIEAWKKTVDVQMHFNDLAMRIRSFALTIIAAMLAASGLAQASANNSILIATLVVWLAFYLMDRFWYHALLKGAVFHGMDIERQAKALGLTLSGEYSEQSDNSLIGLTIRISNISMASLKMVAHRKMDLYYLIVFVALLVIFLVS